MMLAIIIPLVILSFIQSIFGVGLLLFGTPTFILMGYSYNETLLIVLPPSIMISLFQTIRAMKYGIIHKKDFLFFALPMLLLGLMLILYFKQSFEIKKIIGSMLLFSGFIRIHAYPRKLLTEFLKCHTKIYLSILGFVHGISNMGGGLLTLWAGAISAEKMRTRGIISFCYLIMGLIQISVILLFGGKLDLNIFLTSLTIAFGSFLVAERFFFKNISEKIFAHAVTFLTIIYGVTILLK